MIKYSARPILSMLIRMKALRHGAMCLHRQIALPQLSRVSPGVIASGYSSSTWQHSADPRSKHFWTEKDMPDQDGKTFVITGASSGMGLVTAENIAKKGGHVIIASRNLSRSQEAAERIKRKGARGSVEAMLLDLTSFGSIVNFAEAFKKKRLPLHCLVENAGVFLTPYKRTDEDFEVTVGINYYGVGFFAGHFLLSHLLMDSLKDTAQRDGEARLVKMTSLFELLGTVHFDDLEGRNSRDSGLFEYGNSKIMVIMAGREINKRLKGSGVEVFLAQPGLVQTELAGPKLDHRKIISNILDFSANIYGMSTERGALCLERPATDPTIRGYGGSYFTPPFLWILAIHLDIAGMREPGNSLARDEAAWYRLYRESVKVVNRKLVERGSQPISEI